jgi:catechol 2,3-dioxygenase-like lactoylglutathione lyase family enzyme
VAAEPKPRLKKLVASLGVSDLPRSLRFYRDCLGFEVVDSYEDDAGGLQWVFLRSGVAELMLQQLSPEEQITLEPALGHSWRLFLRPADLEDVRRRLLATGLPVTEIELTAYGARECHAKDPDGYDLWLSEPESGLGEDDEDDEDDDEDDTASPPVH